MGEPFRFPQLDDQTRALMLEEIDLEGEDLKRGVCVTPRGFEDYPSLLRDAASSGTERDLMDALNQNDRITTSPVNAAERLAGTEFNRFYVRAVCRKANKHGTNEVVVIRARPSKNPRGASEAIVGETRAAQTLRDVLRTSNGVGDALGVADVNSGLSVRCGCDQCEADLGDVYPRRFS